mmetsp:Transcript_45758/g.141437  ORF Transcript_45758/g.141437 Transcript_45758/m.141437 type:complete len:242 (-) Transcript_45758:58-783(-)
MAMAPIFDEAIDKIFSKWTLLALAVEQGWGGRDSRQKRNQLQAEVLDYLEAGSKRRRPPSHENEGDVEALANLMYGRLDELFNVEADDGSDMEVAGLILRLFNSCRAGDLSFAQSFLQAVPNAPADLSRCQGVDATEYATEEDRLLDQMQSMMLVEGGGDGSEDGAESGEEPDDSMDQDEGAGAAVGAAAGAAAPSPCAATGAGLAADAAAQPGRAAFHRPEPTVDEDGFTSVVKGRRRPR